VRVTVEGPQVGIADCWQPGHMNESHGPIGAVILLDLKTDRERSKLLIQKWTWLDKGPRAARRRQIEEALHRFERFQLAR
jgi:hypothetical protein